MEFDNNSPFAALIPQLEAITTQITEIDSKLAGLAGTHAARKAEALAKLTQIDENAYVARTILAEQEGTDASEIDVSDLPTVVLSEAILALEIAKSAHDEAKQAVDEAVNAALREDKTATTTERDSMLATRESLVTAATSMATLVSGATKPVTASDLGISKPKGTGSTSSGGTRAKTSKGVFSYRRDGQDSWTVPNEHQQSLSSIAFRVFDRATVGEVREALEGQDETVSWEKTVTVKGKTATIKFEVTPAEATPAPDNNES